MSILYAGIDLAKNVFAVHGVDEAGGVQLRQPKVARNKLGALIAALPPCVVAMEACSGAHHWARQFHRHGHTVKLMAPKLVAPYRLSGKQGKNDAADAQAICEAVQRPNMRFVPIKSEEQQSRLMVHRARQGFITARTATINRIRGLLSEFGIVLPLKAEVARPAITSRSCPATPTPSSATCSARSPTWTSASSSTTDTFGPWPATAPLRSSSCS